VSTRRNGGATPQYTPEGYPRDLPAFGTEVKRTLHRRRGDLSRANQFLEELAEALRDEADKSTR
jgi:hypothetical protein